MAGEWTARAGGGHRFDPSIILLDPSATALSDSAIWGRPREYDPVSSRRRSLFFRKPYHWREDMPPLTPLEDTIIYELHVRGFTCDPSSGVARPGTFLGLVEKIPYLQDLGVTAVELLPVHEFEENDCPFQNPRTGEQLRNLWGYNSIAFAAPKAAYAATGNTNGQVGEFRDMVRAFHAAGIEVYLDVVFNPHRRRRRPRPDLFLSRSGQRAVLHARSRRQVPKLLRLREHDQLQPFRGAQPAADVPPLLGRRHACGRSPLRPRLGAGPRLSGQCLAGGRRL